MYVGIVPTPVEGIGRASAVAGPAALKRPPTAQTAAVKPRITRGMLRARPGFEQPLDGRQELCRERTVERAMVPTQAQDRHRPHGDSVAALAIAHHHGTLGHRFEIENRHLWLVDDR